MSEQTYLSLHTSSPVALTTSKVDSVLKFLQVIEPLSIYRALSGTNGWQNFLNQWSEYPADDILDKRITVEEAGSFCIPDRFLLIDCIKGRQEDLRAQVVELVHKKFPDEVKRDFYLNNLSIKCGPHDIFETTENPQGKLFAQTNFSVSIWGYRHPSDLAALRNFLLSSQIVKQAQAELSNIVGDEVQAVVYLA
jgi:hypothetical protein